MPDAPEVPRPDADDEDDARIVEAVIYLYTESRRLTKELARAFGLTGPQVTALKLLDAMGGMSLSDLSARMSARNSTVTGIADRMERDGLVERQRDENDRRVVRIRLTPRGRALSRQIPVESMEVFGAALRALDPKDRRDLRRILRRLSDRVEEEVKKTERHLEQVAEGDAP
ncbi:MAG: MarR family transcriptional regulator [Sandaracinus sp.]|nr:MarR family transcriptional regulator [Sandaracinus sp.]|tara:strand:+ start:1327 stop:1842 length:516 start_codon:yes stop_codon:yes gene_type:complete